MTNRYNTINNKLKNLLKDPIHIKKDKIWFQDIQVLFNNNRLDEFFPYKDMTVEEQLNSFGRDFGEYR